MHLDRIDRRLLRELDHNSRASVSELSKKLKLGNDIVAYRIEKFKRRKVINRFSAYIDVFRLGKSLYKTYLKLKGKREEIDKMVTYLNRAEDTYWLAEFYGKWDLIFSIWAENSLEYQNILDHTLSKFSDLILDSSIVCPVITHRIPRSFGIKSPETSFKYGASREVFYIDELERGLEPYRLRKFMGMLTDSQAQCFITTHSPIALGLLGSGSLWYLDSRQNIGELPFDKTQAQLKRDPETFLSKVAVIVEGETEQGFVTAVLEKLLGCDPLNVGVRVANGQGDNQLLALLEALQGANLCFCGFADNDSGNSGRWNKLKGKMGARLYQWDAGCIETNILPLVPDEKIEILLQDEDGHWDGDRLRTIADRLDAECKDFEALLEQCNDDRGRLKQLIIEAATGDATTVDEEDKTKRKTWKKHSQKWFKRADGSGGRELIKHLVQTSQWGPIEKQVRPFFNSILKLVEREEVERIKL